MGLLPIEQVEYGVNYACFSNGEKRFICSCQKKSIVNRLRLYEKYFCKLGYYDIMTGITYGANDPELKKKVLGLPPALERQIDFTRDIIEQIDFKPYICHNCNNASAAFFRLCTPNPKSGAICRIGSILPFLSAFILANHCRRRKDDTILFSTTP